MIKKSLAVMNEYPKSFWSLIIITFIDHIGGFMLYPFFALYITKRFEVGMTEVGWLFLIFAISGMIGSTMGGAISDRLGRKGILVFGLIATSLSSLAMGFANSMVLFFILATLSGITDVGGPARQAMVADLLPEEKRAQGYGMIRVAFNVSAAIGPAIGGFLAASSYLTLFITDAVISIFAAILIVLMLPETKPGPEEDTPLESMGQTFSGYLRVFNDGLFLLFMGVSMLSALVYMNMNATMGVYLVKTHHLIESDYGFLLSINAAMVVIMQFWITRRIEKKAPFLMMTFGTFLYALGFGMYAFTPIKGAFPIEIPPMTILNGIELPGLSCILTGVFLWFLIGMVIITIGEMIIAPVSQSLVARFAPEDMRGRYMAIFGYSWALPFAIGPILAGLIMDNYDPRILWMIAGLIGLASTAGFYSLNFLVPRKDIRKQAHSPEVNGGA
ncbi:MAG: MFS transporter [Anaerolineales bacterium]|nr:MFS transporter [Anaerolineales bacterium]